MFDTENPYIEVFEAFVKTQSLFSKRIFARYVWNKLFDYLIYYKDYSWLEDILEIAYDEFVSYYKKALWFQNLPINMKLEELHDFFKVHNYNICIASGSSVTHIKRLVKNYGFDLKADLMLSSKDVYASKSAPDQFLACAIEMSVVPENFDEDK